MVDIAVYLFDMAVYLFDHFKTKQKEPEKAEVCV